MSRKTTAAYLHLFKYINEHVMSLECSSFMSDFELAMRNALRTLFPHIDQYTCWFHFAQAIRRKLNDLPELKSLVRTDKDARKLLYKFMAIPLLPADKIINGFQLLVGQSNDAFTRFITYFENQWLKKVSCFHISLCHSHMCYFFIYLNRLHMCCLYIHFCLFSLVTNAQICVYFILF